MTRRTRTPIWIVASVLALAGCAHPAGVGNANPRSSGQGGFGAVGGGSLGPNPYAGDPTATQTNNSNTGNGTGNGGGTTTRSPSPSPARTGPQIISFSVTKRPSCPVIGTPDAPQSYPGQPVTISWKISGASGVTLSVDGPGKYRDYDGSQGSEILSFPCDTDKPTTTHTYTIRTLGGNAVTKTITVSAPSKP